MANKVKRESSTTLLQLPLIYRGVYSTVARREQVSRQFVFQVARGLRRSPRIESAIQDEMRRREEQARKLKRRSAA